MVGRDSKLKERCHLYVNKDRTEKGSKRATDQFLFTYEHEGMIARQCGLCRSRFMPLGSVVVRHLSGSKHQIAYDLYCRIFDGDVIHRRERPL
jgi:hypothetical protein